MSQIPVLSTKMDHTCICSPTRFISSSFFDEIFEEVSTPSSSYPAFSSNSIPTLHPFLLYGSTQSMPIQHSYYRRLAFDGGDHCYRVHVYSFSRMYHQHLRTAKRSGSVKSKNNEKRRSFFVDTGKEEREEYGDVDAMLSLLSEEAGDRCRYNSKTEFGRIRSVEKWRNANLARKGSLSCGNTASPTGPDHEPIDFKWRKRGIVDEREKKDYSSSDKFQMIKESFNFSPYGSIFLSDGEDDAQDKGISSFNETLTNRNTFDKEVIGDEIIRDCETSSRFHENPSDKKGNVSAISKVSQDDRKVAISQKENEITFTEISLTQVSSETLEKKRNAKKNFIGGKKIEEERTEIASDGSQGQSFYPDVLPDVNQRTSHVQNAEKSSRYMGSEVKYSQLYKTSHNNQSGCTEDVHVSRTNFDDSRNNTPENSHLSSCSSITEVGKEPPKNFDSTEEIRHLSVENGLNNQKSFTSSIEETKENEERYGGGEDGSISIGIQSTRQDKTLNDTPSKETNLSKEVLRLDDRGHGDTIILGGKHGGTIKLLPTLSSSSDKRVALPVQLYGGYSTYENSSVRDSGALSPCKNEIGVSLKFIPDLDYRRSEANSGIIATNSTLDSVRMAHRSASDIKDKNKLSGTGMGNERQLDFNQSVHDVFEMGDHDSRDSVVANESLGSVRKIHISSEVNREMSATNLNIESVRKMHSDGSGNGIVDKNKLSKDPVHDVFETGDRDSKDPVGTNEASTSDDPSAGKNSILKRTRRSFWSVLAELIQLRWRSVSGSHNSNIRSCMGSLSTESVKSDEWFSVREEHIENIHKNGENGRKKSTETANIMEMENTVALGFADHSVVELTESSDKPCQAEVEIPSFWGAFHEARKSSGSTAFKSVSTSPPSPLSSIRRLIGYQLGGSVDSASTGSSARDPNEVTGFVGREVVLEKGQQKREKQVVKESFGEWEEGNTLESEQQQIDEMFMREALSESKKAADAWEVPVGAVLVRGGKIIARGCNLVEEKRDCTAHAEMICIREASNMLNSWRLAGTTLYVTLEPCPMCAGAILQARVDTLVWGAPNKIIGADGSWIRLFPRNNCGYEWEMGEKPAAPVHPLHPNMKVRRLVLASECADTMQSFFQLRRRSIRNKVQESDPSSPPYRHPSTLLSKIHQIFHIFCV